jgi:hypothetical protein
MHKYLAAFKKHETAATAAWFLLKTWCNPMPPRVPGMDTVIRLAWRIECGRTVEQAAAREYIYRWNLAIRDFDQCGGGNGAVSIFGAPHSFGL